MTQQRRPRPKAPRGPDQSGKQFEVTVGPIAHGGHCVARLADGPVIFVRHSVPGERVLVEITEGAEGDKFWRGDAIEVLSASPDRVEAPCSASGPGRCGGCDFQHVKLAAQRELKATVVREQFSRLAKLDLEVEVLPVAGDQNGLRWRDQVGWVEIPGGERGLRMHRSHQVMIIDDCLVERLDAPASDERVVLRSVTAGTSTRDFQVDQDGFWQAHPGAAQILTETLLDLLAPQPGEAVLDLYSGVGLFASFFAGAVEADQRGRVVAVEGDARAAVHARRNLGGFSRASVVAGDVRTVLRDGLDQPFDLIILDPPRVGAKRAVVEQIVDRAPRAIGYVSCDPAALARDTAYFAELGYHLADLKAFDLFPMTHHVECVALLTKTGSELR